MGLFERLFGRKQRDEPRYDEPPTSQRARQDRQALPHAVEGAPPAPGPLTDEQAIARYRYMLRTAPPEVIEQAHEEAFARLTPPQRAAVLRELAETMPPGERARLAADQDDPRALARLATRAEIRRPGILERLFGGIGPGYGYGPGYGGMYGGVGMGMGMGGVLGGSLLASIAGGFIGSMIADEFFAHMDHRDFDDSGAAGAGLDPGATNDPMGVGQPMDWQNPGDPSADDANAPDNTGDPGLYPDPGAFDPGADYAPDPGMDAGSDFGGDFGGDGGIF
jgi:hypothetical protein